MPDKEDVLFYAGYGFVIVMLGLMILLFSVGFLGGWEAFGIWLLSLSLILIGLGNVRTETAPHGSTTLIGGGLIFAIISIAVLGIITEIVTPLTAFALLILLCGIGIFFFGIKRIRSTS
ncbi:MAG: hypothetical protein JSV56_06785 [Methanomassiliicoccales archaeon]|nr:MAG: hypothetical protein JSV56_06785 [Methanomassiliicoccales archaeon]